MLAAQRTQVQNTKKHTKNFSMKNFGSPQRPRGQKGLSLENPQKSLKRGFPGSKKFEKESKNDIFSTFFSGVWLVFDSFSNFFSPGAERRGEPLFGLFSDSSRERPF